MRMWMVDPKIMCRKHLLGEHVETHMLAGTLRKGVSIRGYLEKGLCEPHKINARHDALADEMLQRGYNHNSLLPQVHYVGPDTQVNRDTSKNELLRRCPECLKRSKTGE